MVYECIKYSVCTGRSFFAATNELEPHGFWPWFWAVVAILTWAWPAWMGGAVIAAQRFTGIGNPPISGLPPHYIWAVLALALVLVVFYFSDQTYAFLAKFFSSSWCQHRAGAADHGHRGEAGTLLAGAGWAISASPSFRRATRTPCRRPTRWLSSTSPAAA